MYFRVNNIDEYKKQIRQLKKELARSKANYKVMVWTVIILTILNIVKIIINILH